jgi:hypothetical protein
VAFPPVDISPGKDFIESFMVDTCTITRDSRGILDDMLDPSTGALVRPSGDAQAVYSGKCIARARLPRARPFENVPGEGFHERKFFELLIPIAVSNVELGDIVHVTSSNDPRFLDLAMQVMDYGDGTWKTYRLLQLIDITYEVKAED